MSQQTRYGAGQEAGHEAGDETGPFESHGGGTDPGNDFDALTELFLGDSPESREERPAVERLAEERPRGVLRIASDTDEDEEVPGAPLGAGLGGAPRGERERAPKAHVRALILGHLPVFASAWANQYARRLAREVGRPVAALRIRGGESSLHLVGHTGVGYTGGALPCATLAEAIETARAITPYWVLRVGEMDEPALAASEKVDEVTLLTGVDEAAVVASYRTLKRLVPGDSSGPEVTIAVMGADEARARPIVEKISRAARTFLERDVRVVCCIEKISGGGASELFSGSAELSVADAVERITAGPVGAVRPAREARVDRPAEASWQGVRPGPEDWREPSDGLADGPVYASIDGMGDGLGDGLGIVETRPVTPRARPGSRAEIGGMAGIETLEARCPYAPEIGLGVDGAGALHVIAPAGLTVDAALRSLATARSWAVDHRDLIALTRPGAGIRQGREEPTAHLITRSPPDVRRVLDTHVRVHLEVEAGGAVVRVPLN